MILNMSTDYSYPFVLPYGQVQLRLDNTSFPYADGLNREPNLLRIGMVRISERTTNSHTFLYQFTERSAE